MKSEFYYISRVYYTSVLGAEFIALLCSVSRVASASLEEGETAMLAQGTKIFVDPGEHGFSFFQVKMFTGSVSVLLTSTSSKIKKINK